MAQVDVFDRDKNPVSKINLPEAVFGVKAAAGLVHEAVVNHLANARQGTAATKSKGMVSGGGRKPYKQKGTGRARAGSTRSPLYKGGGTVFGPMPRTYTTSMPKKMRRVALAAAFTAKQSDGEVMVVDALGVKEPKTREVVRLMSQLGLSGRVTFIVPEKDEMFERAARNLRYVRVLRVGQIGVYDVVNGGHLVIAASAVAKLEEVSKG